MPIYTPPALNAVDGALIAYTKPDVTPCNAGLTAYTVPALNAVDAALVPYSVPVCNRVNRELLNDANPGDRLGNLFGAVLATVALAWQPAAYSAIRFNVATQGSAPAAAQVAKAGPQNQQIIARAWQQPDYTLLRVSTATLDGTWSGYTPDNPPVRLRAAPPAIAAWQPPDYSMLRVSTATLDGTWTGYTPDNPPVRLQTLPAAVQAWQPPDYTAQRFTVATLDGTWVGATTDAPPPRREWLSAVLLQHQPPTYSTYASGIFTEVIDSPIGRPDYATAIGQWTVTWGAQRANQGLAFLFVPVTVDNPIPHRLEVPPAVWAWQPAAYGMVRVTVTTQDGPTPVVPPVVATGAVQLGGLGLGRKRHELTYEDWRAFAEFRDAVRQLRAEAEKPKPVIRKAAEVVNAAVAKLEGEAPAGLLLPVQRITTGRSADALLGQIARIEREVGQLAAAYADWRQAEDDKAAALAAAMQAKAEEDDEDEAIAMLLLH